MSHNCLEVTNPQHPPPPESNIRIYIHRERLVWCTPAPVWAGAKGQKQHP